MSTKSLIDQIHRLNEIGVALSVERDHARLMEIILFGAKELTQADGGSLYIVTKNQTLKFEIVTTDSLNLYLGGTSGSEISFPEILMYDLEGKPNEKMVVAYSAVHAKTVNIKDAYVEDGFDFSGTKEFDRGTGYRSRSFLTVPMLNYEKDVIGVLQLINAKDSATGKVIPFSEENQSIVESLSSQAAISITNQQLVNRLNALFEGFTESIAKAIDAKSPYTANHCQRVPVITRMLAEAINGSNQGRFKEFQFTKEELYELHLAALLHDCGKVITPVHVIDKSNRLETIYDRIQMVETRFYAYQQQLYIEYLEKLLKMHLKGEGTPDRIEALENNYLEEKKRVQEGIDFIKESNDHLTFMDRYRQEVVKKIAKWQWKDPSEVLVPILTEEEVENLCIMRGTLNHEERKIINEHVVHTIRMLEHLPYPKHLKNLATIAGNHHERVDGKGYPSGKTGDEMSVQDKILALADVFEALTSRDRPYKAPLPISKVLEILQEMADTGHLDPELYKVFVDQKVFLRYGKDYLDAEQIDVCKT